MTVNGELHKLAHNISFGHGIHEGIHWRSDTDYSMLLGEEVALIVFKRQSPNLQRRSLDNDHKNERTNVRSYQKFIAAAQRKPGTPAKLLRATNTWRSSLQINTLSTSSSITSTARRS